MSEKIGPLTFGKQEEQIFLGREIAQHRDYSESTAMEIDKEVKRIVLQAYETDGLPRSRIAHGADDTDLRTTVGNLQQFQRPPMTDHSVAIQQDYEWRVREFHPDVRRLCIPESARITQQRHIVTNAREFIEISTSDFIRPIIDDDDPVCRQPG